MAGVLTLAQLYVVAAAAGLAGPFFSTAETAAVRAVVPAEQLPTAYSQNQVRGLAAELCGSPIGGALYTLGRALPFGLDALTFLLEAIAVRSIRTPLPAPECTDHRPVWHDIGAGLAFIWRHPFLRTTLLAGGIINFASLWPVLLLTLHDQNVPASLIGATLSALTIAGLLGSFAAPIITRRAAPGRIIIGSSWILVAALAVMAATSSVLLMLVALLLGLTAVPVIGVLLPATKPA